MSRYVFNQAVSAGSAFQMWFQIVMWVVFAVLIFLLHSAWFAYTHLSLLFLFFPFISFPWYPIFISLPIHQSKDAGIRTLVMLDEQGGKFKRRVCWTPLFWSSLPCSWFALAAYRTMEALEYETHLNHLMSCSVNVWNTNINQSLH